MIDIAFTTLVHESAAPLERALARWTGSRDAAPDLAQETFLRAYRGRSGVRDAARARGWIFAIARQVVVDWRRREGRRRAEPLGEREPVAAGAEAGAGPVRAGGGRDAGLSTDARRAIVEAVAALEPDLRSVVELKYDAALTYDEIGAIEGVPASTVQARLRAARRELARRLSERAPELVPAVVGAAGAAGAARAAGVADTGAAPSQVSSLAYDAPPDAASPDADAGAAEIAEALGGRDATSGLAERSLDACSADAGAAASVAGAGARAAAGALEGGRASAGLSLGAKSGLAGAAVIAALVAALLVPWDGGASTRSSAGADSGSRVAPRARAVADASAAVASAGTDVATKASSETSSGRAEALSAAGSPASVGSGAAAADARAVAASSTATAAAAPGAVELVSFREAERLLASRSVSINFPDVPARVAIGWFRDITGIHFGIPLEDADRAQTRMSLRLRDCPLATTLDLACLVTPCEMVVTEAGVAVTFPPPGARPALRRRSPLERINTRNRAPATLEALVKQRPLESANGALGERLRDLSEKTGINMVPLPGALPDRAIAGALRAESAAGLLDVILAVAGGPLEWRILDAVVIVGREHDMPPEARRMDAVAAHPALPGVLDGPPIDLPRLRAPTPRELAEALAACGHRVQIEHAALELAALPIALGGTATAAEVNTALGLAAADAGLIEVDGILAVMATPRRQEERAGEFGHHWPIEDPSPAFARWFEARRARGRALASEIERALVDGDLDRPLSERVAQATTLSAQRVALVEEWHVGGIADAARVFVRLAEAWKEPEGSAELASLLEEKKRAEARPAAEVEALDQAAADRLAEEASERSGRIRALERTARLRRVGARWRDALERYEAGASPEEVFRGEHARLAREVESAR